MDPETLNWPYLQALLDPKCAIAKQQKTGGAVEYWREWDAVHQCAVWVKTYRNSGEMQLDAFNQAEIEILMQLADHKVPNTYRSALIERVGTQLGVVGRGAKTGAHYTLKTKDAGPTLDDWLRAPTTAPNYSGTQAHMLVSPENFLQLAQYLLNVLDGIHGHNYVHCDIHPGNITLPSRLLKHSFQELHVELLWDQITFIDFGYSINRHTPPRTTLPYRREGTGTRISPHLASCLADIETQANAYLAREGDSLQWADIYLNPGFWQRWQGASPLQSFREMDWREDLYQLGCMLSDIRDGVGMASHLEGCTIKPSPLEAVNQLIDELPQELKDWGQGVGSPAPAQPHQDYVSQIGKVLAAARQKGHIPHSSYRLHHLDFHGGDAHSPQPDPKPPTPKSTTLIVAPLPVRPAPAAPAHILRPLTTSALALPVMQPVPSGRFLMGSEHSADCQPLHTVQIKAPAGCVLAISQTAISCAQWASAGKLNPQLCAVRPGRQADATGPDYPMVNISWTDCVAYLDTLNFATDLYRQPAHLHYRMLTEAEWEFAARAGTTEAANGRYWWGDEAPATADSLPLAMAGKPNPWGLYGMGGLIWEWVADHHHSNYDNAPSDGSAWCNAVSALTAWHQVRGASWATPPEAQGLAVRASHANSWRSPYIGLRIARWMPAELSSTHYPELK